MYQKLAFLLIFCAAAWGEELPLLGLAHVGIRVQDLQSARGFYHDIVGLDEAFTTKKPDGSVSSITFKVNDRQFIRIIPGLTSADVTPMSYIAFRTDRIGKLRKMLMKLGLSPTAVAKDPEDGTLAFMLPNPPGQMLSSLKFVQYTPGSLQTKSKGAALSDRRMSQRLEHAGIVTTDLLPAKEFYVKVLGFRETWSRTNSGRIVLIHLRAPSPSGDYVELVNQTGIKDLKRERAGEAAHFSLEVPDAKSAYEEGLRRSKDVRRQAPRFGMDERWQTNLFDPDGTRVEFMQPRDPSKKTPVPPAVVP